MRQRNDRPARRGWVLLLCACALATGATAEAATVEVCWRVDAYRIAGPTPPATAGPFGNKAPIPMWGFVETGRGPGCTFASPPPAATANAVAFPQVDAREGDTLVVHLANRLPAATAPAYATPPLIVAPGVYSEPVSVVIPGQPGDLVPTWTDGTRGNRSSPTQRVRSFTHETPVGPAVIDYTFGPLKPGTFLVESGTHPAVQVQMGLYGVLRVLPTVANRAYDDPSTGFTSEATLLFSEIDPALHDAIGAGTYGPGPSPPSSSAPAAVLPSSWRTSTVDYHPKYFLVDGRPYTAGASPIPIGAVNRRILLRLLNAGLATKVPLMQGQYVDVIAEDANLLVASGVTPRGPATCPAPREQYSVLLPAGKTVDALLTAPSAAATIPVYDRRLDLTNAGSAPGGMLAFLAVTQQGGATLPPTAPPPCVLVGGGAAAPSFATDRSQLTFFYDEDRPRFHATLQVTLVNHGAVAGTITGASVVGPAAADFHVTPSHFPVVVPPGGSATLDVTAILRWHHHHGSLYATYSAELDVGTDDAKHRTFVVPLSVRPQ